MRTNPFLDSLLFLIGYDPNYKPLGLWQYPLIVFFDVLVVANLVLAFINLRDDPLQRRGRSVFLWVARSLIGAMWFQGTLWKLPLPVSGGFSYWMNQIAQNAAWGSMQHFYHEVLIPNIAIINIVAYVAETCFAISLMLGLAVRLTGIVGVLFTANIWLGLYHNSGEWPWQYMFLMLVMGFLALDDAGRGLGLDALLRRWSERNQYDGSLLIRLHRLVS